jgi:hypothetical protein
VPFSGGLLFQYLTTTLNGGGGNDSVVPITALLNQPIGNVSVGGTLACDCERAVALMAVATAYAIVTSSMSVTSSIETSETTRRKLAAAPLYVLKTSRIQARLHQQAYMFDDPRAPRILGERSISVLEFTGTGTLSVQH